MAVNLPEKKFLSRNRITGDFLSDFNKVKEFYGPHFRNEEEVSTFVRGGERNINNNAAISEILRKQNSVFGSGRRAMENIDALASGKSLCVVTGQQVGIFTGPLYTVYKAITAVKFAEHLSNKFNLKVVPVFWMASNDHDFEEVRSVSVMDSDNALRTLSYTPKSPVNEKPLGKVMLEDSFDNLVCELDESFPDSGFRKNAL
ncbi:MAG: bacillithiol biosynthesis protein BshC, partial [Planctomycetota bacterium]